MKFIYLANGLGFSRFLSPVAAQIKDQIQEKTGFWVLEPFFEGKDQSAEIEQAYQEEKDIDRLKERLADINFEIGKRNMRRIDDSKLVVAVLDGSGADVDSGVAAEIGYAVGRGMKVLGLRTDFRTGDNIAAAINLQVEFFIKESGGAIYSEIDALVEAINESV